MCSSVSLCLNDRNRSIYFRMWESILIMIMRGTRLRLGSDRIDREVVRW